MSISSTLLLIRASHFGPISSLRFEERDPKFWAALLLMVPRHYFHSRKDFLDLLWMLSRTFWHACSLDRKRTRTGIKIISINHSRIHSAQPKKCWVQKNGSDSACCFCMFSLALELVLSLKCYDSASYPTARYMQLLWSRFSKCKISSKVPSLGDCK